MGRSRYKVVADGKTYFLTGSTLNRLPLFAAPALAEIVIDSLNFLHQQERLTVHARVLTETHFYDPVKRGFVDRPEHRRHSSARDYAGVKGLMDIARLA